MKTKEIIAEISDTINIDIEVELPEDVKVAEGKYLSAMTTSNAGSYEVVFYETDEPVIQEGMPEVDLGYGITGYQDAGGWQFLHHMA